MNEQYKIDYSQYIAEQIDYSQYIAEALGYKPKSKAELKREERLKKLDKIFE